MLHTYLGHPGTRDEGIYVSGYATPYVLQAMRPQHPVAVTPHDPRRRPAPHSRPPASQPTTLPRYRPRRQPAPGRCASSGTPGGTFPARAPSFAPLGAADCLRLHRHAPPLALLPQQLVHARESRTCTAAAASPHTAAGTSTVVCACARACSCLHCTGLESLEFFAQGWSRTSRRAPAGTIPSLAARTKLLSCFGLLFLFARHSFLFLSRQASPRQRARTRPSSLYRNQRQITLRHCALRC